VLDDIDSNDFAAKRSESECLVIKHFVLRCAFCHTARCTIYSSGTYRSPPLGLLHPALQQNVSIWQLHMMASVINTKNFSTVVIFIVKLLFNSSLLAWQIADSDA